MLGRISTVAVTAAAVLALGVAPASAAKTYRFDVTGPSGVHSWGSFTPGNPSGRIQACVKNTGRSQAVVLFIKPYDRNGGGGWHFLRNTKGPGKVACASYTTPNNILSVDFVPGSGTRKQILQRWPVAKKWGTHTTIGPGMPH